MLRLLLVTLFLSATAHATLVNNVQFPDLTFHGPNNSTATISRWQEPWYQTDNDGPLIWVSDRPERAIDVSLNAVSGGVAGTYNGQGYSAFLIGSFAFFRIPEMRDTPLSEYSYSFSYVMRSGVVRKYYSPRPSYVYESLRRLPAVGVQLSDDIGGSRVFSGWYSREVAVPEPNTGASLLIPLLILTRRAL